MKYAFLVIIVFYLMSCAASKSVSKHETNAGGKYDESFDPLTLNDNDIDFPSIKPAIRSENKNSATIKKSDQFQKEVNGYRVQIIATQNLEKATLLEEQAKSQFAMSGHKTYLVFETPLYKIRIGDFTSRNQADELKMQALKYGYREAFIVKSKVSLNTSTNTPDM